MQTLLSHVCNSLSFVVIPHQLDIFDFKRFYEEIRESLSGIVKRDYPFKKLESAKAGDNKCL
jgi:hypothetical protein